MTGSIELPVVGPVPSPFVSLVAFVLAGYVLARLLGLQARWLGSRWAGRVRERVTCGVEAEVRERALAPLDRLEDARRRIGEAAAVVEGSCGSTAQGS